MKKLFSYLLISSMVVLSSCTNYDDQFDDLNSQITSLKAQIEGFNSLSSGLTALQGTVASLQSAVAAIPTTQVDVSGLEASVAALQTSLASAATSEEAAAIQTQLTSAQAALASAIAANATASDTNADSIAALQTSLEAVTATLEELKTSLAAASTAAEVAALSTSLAAVQADLTDLLSSNNIYTPANNTLNIKSVSQLTFANGLGDKISIINGSIDVEQTADMDATTLAAVLAKVKSVTANVDFKATATGVTPVAGFSALTGATDITYESAGNISFPALETAGVVTLKDNSKTLTVSLPKLKTVTTLKTSTNHDLAFAKGTSVDLSSLSRYGANLSITVKSGSINLASLESVDSEGKEYTVAGAYDLTLSGASVIELDKFTRGGITANKVKTVDFPLWKGTTGSVFADATKVVLPSITGGVSINLSNFAAKAQDVHFIGAQEAISSIAYNYPSFTTGSSTNTEMTKLKLEGKFQTVTIDASELADLDLTGNANYVSVANTSITDMVLGHTSKVDASSRGSLSVTDNLDLETLTFDSLDDISSLTITGNTSLSNISAAALNSLGLKRGVVTATALGATAILDISGNDLSASSIQLPSAYQAVPVVAGKITTDSGLDALSTYIKAAIAAKTAASHMKVAFDNVTEVLDADGDSYTGAVNLVGATAAAASAIQSFSTEDQTLFLVNLTAGETAEGDDALKQRSTYGIQGAAALQTAKSTGYIKLKPYDATDIVSMNIDDAFKAKYGVTNTFDADDLTTWGAHAETELNALLDAGSHPFTVEIRQDFGKTAEYQIRQTIDGTLDSDGGTAGQPLTFTFDNVTMSGVVHTDTDLGVMGEIAKQINKSSNPLTRSWSAATAASPSRLILTPRVDGITDNSSSVTFPDFSFPAQYAKSTSDVTFLQLSATLNTTAKEIVSGWRMTVINDSYTVNAPLLDLTDASTASFTTQSGVTFTELVSGSTISDSQTSLQVNWTDATAGTPDVTTGTKTVNLVSWL